MKKDKTIETLRGAAILLVVIGHVIGDDSNSGMGVRDDSFLRYIYYSLIEPVQMPLFTILAGWVYALKPLNNDILKPFLTKKVYRLLIPMFVVGCCYFIVQYYTPGTNDKMNLEEIWKLLFFPYTTFWYLYSLFFVFVIVTLLDVIGKMKTVSNWMIVFSISIIILLIRDLLIPYNSPNYFSYKGTLYLLPSFLLGLGLNRFKELFQNSSVLKMSVVMLIGSVLVQQLYWFNIIDVVVSKDNLFGLIIGFALTIILLKSQVKANWLIWLGGISYSIYLFHGFGTAAGRIIPLRFNINSTMIIFITSLLMGIIFPIITDKIFDRFKLTRMLFLGRY